MGILEAARALGAEIQKDERFIKYTQARLANDNDKELQDGIGEFNVIRMNLEAEMAKEDRDEAKINELNEKLRTIYTTLMSSKAMVDYNAAKTEIDGLLADVNSVIMQCVEGADPATAEPEQHSCSGSCDSCGGCH